jgi:phage antirepressor YoqD-like protein
VWVSITLPSTNKKLKMKTEKTNTEKLIEFLEQNNFQYEVDNNPSQAKLDLIKAKILETKKLFNEDGILPETFITKNGVEVKKYKY